MSFSKKDVNDLLVACQRCCVICHRFCGVKIEIHHIEQKADGVADEENNAIPVCFDCHAEITSYNPKHPRGRKFQPEELKGHKKWWMDYCKKNPAVISNAFEDRAVGPLQALIDEMEFNISAVISCKHASNNVITGLCPPRESQFERAVQTGSISFLEDSLKQSIFRAYSLIRTTRIGVEAVIQTRAHSGFQGLGLEKLFEDCLEAIELAHSLLLGTLPRIQG